MLFDAARHEALVDQAWDEGQARALLARIVADTEARFDDALGWPAHPNDSSPADDPAHIGPSLYYGQCGVIWALRYLQRVGAAELKRDWRGQADRLVVRTRQWLGDDAGREAASFLMGETPIELLRWNDDPARASARLVQLIDSNDHHPARELMWGAPGTLLAAWFLHQRTGDEHWRAACRRQAEVLFATLEPFSAAGCLISTQSLYGSHSTYLGAAHGFASMVAPVVRARALLPEGDWRRWHDTIALTLRRMATWHEGAVNWRAWVKPPSARLPLMQFCHGAPGIVLALADFPGDAVDDLLLAAGEAVWRAGPLAKGSNLCHGTGGNGYTFLRLFERTGDERWLQRARAFAMHGLAQTLADERRHGRLRYSLWTGDPGFAVYLWDCLRGRAAFPTLDVF
ncbi:MAG: LanC-like protein [Rubrivivax sp.]|nr:LanC-like protein [Rubrivivax sp.]